MEEFCDVTLVSNNEKRIPAQKVVLASAHTVFRDLFQSDEEQDDYQVIHIKGVKSSFMTAMVYLVYDGETKVKKTEFTNATVNLLEQQKQARGKMSVLVSLVR